MTYSTHAADPRVLAQKTLIAAIGELTASI
jgi:hypothetical protein